MVYRKHLCVKLVAILYAINKTEAVTGSHRLKTALYKCFLRSYKADKETTGRNFKSY